MSNLPDENTNPEPPATLGDLEPEDYYFDGPNLVFTAHFLLKCGACCHSGCRHCPYGEAVAEAAV